MPLHVANSSYPLPRSSIRRLPTSRTAGRGGESNGPLPGAYLRGVAGLVSSGALSPGWQTHIPGASSRSLSGALTDLSTATGARRRS